MSYIKLNGTDINVSKTALGTAIFGKTVDKKTSFRIMDSFFEYGGTLLDTANVYANWLPGEKSSSEKTIGRWMKEKNNRHQVIISTKGAHPIIGNEKVQRLSKSEIISDIEDSLINLGTDYIDVYFLHRDDVKRTVGEIMQTLHKIVTEGKARSVGLSNWCPRRIAEALKYCKDNNITMPVSSQIQYGIAYPNPENIDPTTEYMHKKAFEFYSKQKLNLFSFSSQSGGYFFCTDSYGRPVKNPAYDSEMSRNKFDLVMEMTKKYSCSVAQVIVSALSSNKAFKTIPIIGGVTEMQIKDSMDGTKLVMEEADVNKLLLREI